MKNLILLPAISILLLFSCDPNQSKIKADLNSRYTKFEIIEMKPDSSNIRDANMGIFSFQITLSNSNDEMGKAAYRFIDKEWSYDKTSKFMDSIVKQLSASSKRLIDRLYARVEPCYYVKYRIFKGELKIEREEYYTIGIPGKSPTIEVLHRPCDAGEFLKENGFDGLNGPLEESYKFYNKFLEALTK